MKNNFDNLKKIYKGKKEISWKDFKIEDFQNRLIKLHAGKIPVKKGRANGKLIFFHPHVEAMKDFFLDDVNFFIILITIPWSMFMSNYHFDFI